LIVAIHLSQSLILDGCCAIAAADIHIRDTSVNITT